MWGGRRNILELDGVCLDGHVQAGVHVPGHLAGGLAVAQQLNAGVPAESC